MKRDDLTAIGAAEASVFTLGEDEEAVTVRVRALQVDLIPAFTQAVEPLLGVVAGVLGGDGSSMGQIATLVREHFPAVKRVLAVATTRVAKGDDADALERKIAEREAEVGMASVDQALELLLGVLKANRDFFSGRLIAALRTAAKATDGAGPTASKP